MNRNELDYRGGQGAQQGERGRDWERDRFSASERGYQSESDWQRQGRDDREQFGGRSGQQGYSQQGYSGSYEQSRSGYRDEQPRSGGQDYGSRHGYGAGQQYGPMGGGRWNEGYNDRESGQYGRGGGFDRGEERGYWGQGARWEDSERGMASTGEREHGDAWSGNWFGASQGQQRQGNQMRGQYGNQYGGQSSGQYTGQHSGKGPKGYQRSDDRIREDVSEALSRHGDVDASEIEVNVQNGEVTLTGTVQDRQQKRLAEDVVADLSGVKDVHNQIRVQHEQGGGMMSQQPGMAQSGSHTSGGRESEPNGSSTLSGTARR